jgi:hypothetical protein
MCTNAKVYWWLGHKCEVVDVKVCWWIARRAAEGLHAGTCMKKYMYHANWKNRKENTGRMNWQTLPTPSAWYWKPRYICQLYLTLDQSIITPIYRQAWRTLESNSNRSWGMPIRVKTSPDIQVKRIIDKVCGSLNRFHECKTVAKVCKSQWSLNEVFIWVSSFNQAQSPVELHSDYCSQQRVVDILRLLQ